MRKLAELAMKSPKYAVLLAVLFASTPALFWLSAAIVSLVILRQGVSSVLKVLMWALLPAIAWAAIGQTGALIALVSTAVLACVLRQTVSWQKTVLTLVPIGTVVATVTLWLSPHLIELISQLVTEILGKSFGLNDAHTLNQLEPMLEFVIAGTIAAFHSAFAAVSLMLARYWQAALYNAGGFGKEFRRVRMPAIAGVALLALILLGSYVSPVLVALIPIASLPLFFAGLGLLHGVVWLKKMGSFWLVGSYALLIVVTQLAYPVIVLMACLDSLIDFRARISAKANI